MLLQPTNKRLLIEPIVSESKSEIDQFVGLSKKRPDNIVYSVLDKAEDCNTVVSVGDHVVVEGNMVEESKVGEQSFFTVKENFIVGVLRA